MIVDSIPDEVLQNQLRSSFREHLEWCDIIDSAQYESARQVVECKEPALQVNLSFAVDRSAKYLKRLVYQFGEKSLTAVANSPEVHPRFLKAMEWQRDVVRYMKRVAEVKGQVVFFDLTARKGLFNRYAAYYLWPETKFLVAVYTNGKGFRLTLSSNPWSTFSGPDLSALAERYGGGGHTRVAGISVPTRRRALQVGKEIASILRGETTYAHQLSLRDQFIRQSH